MEIKGLYENSCPHSDSQRGYCECKRGEPRGKLHSYNWLEDINNPEKNNVVEVLFKNTRTGFYINELKEPLKIGDTVIVEANPGYDLGKIKMTGPLVEVEIKNAGFRVEQPLKKILRLADKADIEKFEEARAKEHSTMIKARAIADELGLSMKIGDVEYQGDGSKAIFYYIADERVDFRKLIRVLAETFKIRVEMKQIGARQEAGRIGGIGPCGRPLCCSSWMKRFVSVGTHAARLQDLSLNPQKLAGQCAKLKCCLNFEIDAYAEAGDKMPNRDIPLETKDATYYYFKSDILDNKLTYSTDRHTPSNLVTISAARALEIIELNKKGIKVDALNQDKIVKPQKDFADIITQESVTRFDKKKKKKKNKNSDKKKDIQA